MNRFDHAVRTRGARLVVVALAALCVLTSCSTTDSGKTESGDQDMTAVKNALAAKGPVEDEIARLDPLMREMADVVVELVPSLTWRPAGAEGDYVGCDAVPGDSISASAFVLQTIAFSGPIPDDVWPQAMSRVRDIAARVGATELVVRADGPGNHDVQWVGPDKVRFGLGTLAVGIVTAKTGCHLNIDEVGQYPK